MATTRPAHEAVLDEALDLLSSTAPEFGGGLSNHGPMAAEALVRLGRPDAVMPWVERYRAQLEEGPRPGRPIDVAGWREGLGHADRYPDWLATFAALGEEESWRSLLSTWLPRLLPGTMAAATHGLIRVAHAARALEQSETPPRRSELVVALAYWTSSYLELPGRPQLRGTLAVPEAAARLPLVPAAARSGGLITESALKAGEVSGWSGGVDALAEPADVDAALSALTAAFAGWYRANATTQAIVFVHGVTAPAALRLLLPYLPAPQRERGFAYAWQACAALRTAFGDHRPPPSGDQRCGAGEHVDEIELADRAVASGDEHAIKLVEACVREHHLHPDPGYLAAAWDVGERLGGR